MYAFASGLPCRAASAGPRPQAARTGCRAPGVICPLSFVAANLIIYWTGWTILWKLVRRARASAPCVFVANLLISKPGEPT